MHKVIIVPGLSDNDRGIKWATKHWRGYDLDVICFPSGWKTNEVFQKKLGRLTNLIDRFLEGGNKVSLVGTSAGGSLVLNAFMERKNNISKVINVCGRLRKGTDKGFRGFEAKTSSSDSFKESVLSFEQNSKLLTNNDRRKIMTIRSLFDELVPEDTTTVDGAHNKQIYSIEHVFSIWMSLSFYKPLKNFLQGV